MADSAPQSQTVRVREMRGGIVARLVGVLLVLFAVVSLVLNARGGAAGGYTPPTTPGDRAPVKVGDTAPDFALRDAQGNPVTLARYRGKPTILVFFRTFG